MSPVTILTFDIDWSPDWIIDEVANMVTSHGVKSTWFVTHAGAAVERLRARADLLELGIHPNCLPGSTHGKNERDVLAHVKSIVPEAVSMRTHGLYQTTGFLMRAARDFGVRIDSSLLFPEIHNIVPHDLKIGDLKLRRAPIYWEDDIAMLDPSNRWKLEDHLSSDNGIRIFAFHPFHIVLNTTDYQLYEKLKGMCPLPQWKPDFIAPYRNKGRGPRDFFLELVEYLESKATFFVRDILEAKG